MKLAAAALLISLAACTGQITGEVRDAATDQPVPGAIVTLSDRGWGISMNQLVWDKDYHHRTRTDGQGLFAFRSEGGNLKVEAPGLPVATGYTCGPPLIVRVGGPYPQLEATRNLLVGLGGRPMPEFPRDARRAEDFGLSVEGGGIDQRTDLAVTFRSAEGLRFVPGVGAIPAVPTGGYSREVTLDAGSDCGWLFVRKDGRVAAVVATTGFVVEQLDQGNVATFMFAELPR